MFKTIIKLLIGMLLHQFAIVNLKNPSLASEIKCRTENGTLKDVSLGIVEIFATIFFTPSMVKLILLIVGLFL